MNQHSFKILPIYLQPRILSAVSYLHQSPNQEIITERINKISRQLSDREMTYVLSLVFFDQLLDMVRNSDECKNFASIKRTLQ